MQERSETAPGQMPSDQERGAIRDLAERYEWHLVVLFGSVAREGTGRDLDLAVLPGVAAERRKGPPLFREARWLRELEDIFHPAAVDLVVLTDGLSPVTRREIFEDGVCLYERRPGLYDEAWSQAFRLYADSAFFRAKAQQIERERQ